ncbi:hypothetical protein AJ80_05335 [Polytolypa hystricis UAMH7299]|uniref:NADP-dependent oxidoreductase domain-containing protein n=1 Tax=Polytolypa hystricis (strain UAMH7299) TaxID=1447883 RepID=A0A2B7Y4G9_POLH7|nr:hypothetical protein AJ80_05335 [Polytolypa hystricis UAMH7299]
MLTVAGVSNFNAPKLKQLLDTPRIQPAVNQVELHPLLQKKAYMAWCTSHWTAAGGGQRPLYTLSDDHMAKINGLAEAKGHVRFLGFALFDENVDQPIQETRYETFTAELSTMHPQRFKQLENKRRYYLGNQNYYSFDRRE